MINNETTQVDPKYVIEALMEENKAMNDNRLYLISLIKQIKAEYEEAKKAWETEKESLTKSKVE